MEEQTREIKGIFIPIEIWTNKGLTWNEKILFMEIDSFTSKSKDCYVSNEYIAKLLGVTETSANKILSSLIKKGYVIKTKFDGRKRWVKSALSFGARQGCCQEQGRVAFDSNIPNNNIPDNNLPDKENNEFHSLKENAKKSNKFDVRADLSYVDDDFRTIWSEWLDYKDEAKCQYNTQRGAKQAYSTLKSYSENNPVLANAIIKQSIEKSWIGFFSLSDKQKAFFLSDKSPYKQNVTSDGTKDNNTDRRPRLEDFNYDKFAYRQALVIYNLEHGIK